MSIDYQRLLLLFSNLYTDQEEIRNAAASRINDFLKRNALHPSDLEIGPRGKLVYAEFEAAIAILEREVESLRTKLARYEPHILDSETPSKPMPKSPIPKPRKPKHPRMKPSPIHLVILRILADRRVRPVGEIAIEAEQHGYGAQNTYARLSELSSDHHFGGALVLQQGTKTKRCFRITDRGMRQLVESNFE